MNKRPLYVLIACEESQAETTAFRALGHIAYSCDILKCRKNTPAEWHIVGDVTPYLHGYVDFVTQDGERRSVPHWDLIISHPPCTYLCKVGSQHLYTPAGFNWERYKNMLLARRFFFECLNAKAPFVAVENPIPMRRACLPRPSCYVQPSWFGVKYTKKTLFWLRNLPPLMPTLEYPNPRCFVTASRGKYRSSTFPQMAEAIASQWSEYVLDNLAKLTT